MSTIYTLNGKVLKNAANDKWLAKKEAPAGFVMNASNAVATIEFGNTNLIVWESPTYPVASNLEGKTVQVKLTGTIQAGRLGASFMYAKGTTSTDGGGPVIAKITETEPGTYTYVCSSNPASAAGYGIYLSIELIDLNDKDKIELTILD